MNTFKAILSTAIIAGSMSGAAFAASDGTLGLTSQGESIVNLQITDQVRISSVADIALGAYAGTGTLVGESEFCVYRNGGDDYSLTLSADTGAFAVNSASTTDNIAFSVKVDDDLDATDGEAMPYGGPSTVALNGADSMNCGGVDNASMQVTFAEADLQAASSGNDYTATVTILVSPI